MQLSVFRASSLQTIENHANLSNQQCKTGLDLVEQLQMQIDAVNTSSVSACLSQGNIAEKDSFASKIHQQEKGSANQQAKHFHLAMEVEDVIVS
jgi:hypothetical protein